MHLSPVVIVVLISVAGFILLYLVARKVKPFGHSLAVVCAVAGSILVTLSYHMESAAHSCNKVCVAALKSINDTGDWMMGDLLRGLIDFFLGLLILVGESIQVIEVLPNLFPAATQVTLPPIAELSSAALFLLCSAAFGELVLDCWRGKGLFHDKGKLSRWIVGILAMLLLIFSDLVMGYFYIFRAEILSHKNTSGMTVYILGGLGLEVSAVSPYALFLVKENSSSVVALLMWFAEKSFEAMHAAATFIPDFLDTIALHLSAGEIGVYGKQIERDPHQYPSFPTSRQLTPGQKATALLSQNAASIAASGKDEIVATTTTITEVSMSESDLEKAAAFMFVCTPRMFELTRQKVAELRATDSILSCAYIDLPVNHFDTAIPGVVDLSPSYADRHATMVHSETEGQAIHTLLTGVGDREVETHQHTKGFPKPFLSFIGCRYLVEDVERLESIKRRLPLHPLVVVTEVDQEDLQDKIVQVGLSDLQALAAEDEVATITVTDPHSPFAASYGIDTQRLFVAHDLVSLLLADKHSLHNLSFTSVLKKLHSLSPFTTIASCSLPVAVGKLPTRLAWLPGVKNQAGIGNYSDILAQTRAAIDRVMNDIDTCMFPFQEMPHVPSTVLVTVPIRLDDARFANCVRDNSLYVSSHYPYTSCITVRGNGCAPPHHTGSRFLVQAARLIPLHPAELFRLHEDKSKSVKVTQLFPVKELETASGNSHTPALEQETKQSKAVTPSRQKKVASARRVGRKNTKQAK